MDNMICICKGEIALRNCPVHYQYSRMLDPVITGGIPKKGKSNNKIPKMEI